MPTATIKIFLAHGDPKRLRIADLSNWNGIAVAGPRSEFDGVLARPESGRTGVYLLTGSDPESGRPAIYIGEAENLRDRVKAHLEKDFWNQIVYFTSKDENLTKAHVKYLEGKLIEKARLAGRSLVTNGQNSGAKLPESDREDMEIFLEKIHQLLPVLGVELLVPSSSIAAAAAEKVRLHNKSRTVDQKGPLRLGGWAFEANPDYSVAMEDGNPGEHHILCFTRALPDGVAKVKVFA